MMQTICACSPPTPDQLAEFSELQVPVRSFPGFPLLPNNQPQPA